MLGYEAVLRYLTHCGSTTEARALERKIALLASDAGDMDRSARYFKLLVARAKEQGKPNELSHLTASLGEMLSALGRHRESEAYMLESIGALLHGPTSSSQAAGLVLMTKLAEAYLAQSEIDNAIFLLEFMLTSRTLPSNKLSFLLLCLCEAYSRKTWFYDAIAMLAAMEYVRYPRLQMNWSAIAGDHVSRVLAAVQKRTGQQTFRFPAEALPFDLTALAVRVLSGVGRFVDALIVLEREYKETSDGGHLGRKARLWLLKGKVRVRVGSVVVSNASFFFVYFRHFLASFLSLFIFLCLFCITFHLFVSLFRHFSTLFPSLFSLFLPFSTLPRL